MHVATVRGADAYGVCLLARVAEGALAFGDRDLLHRSFLTEPLGVATGFSSVEGRRHRSFERTRDGSGAPLRVPV